MPVATLRIIESEEEASLHPRAIWNHWKKNVIWDPRSYYGVLEFNAALIILFSFISIQHDASSFWWAIHEIWLGLLLGIFISPLHWYSNHRQATHLLTRARTHLYVLLILATLLFLSQVFPIQRQPNSWRDRDIRTALTGFLWFSILTLLAAAYVVYTIARNPRKDPTLAELPSPTAVRIEFEDESQAAWASVNVADGIEDDSLEPEGQLRL